MKLNEDEIKNEQNCKDRMIYKKNRLNHLRCKNEMNEIDDLFKIDRIALKIGKLVT